VGDLAFQKQLFQINTDTNKRGWCRERTSSNEARNFATSLAMITLLAACSVLAIGAAPLVTTRGSPSDHFNSYQVGLRSNRIFISMTPLV
jgi:hypothetical protein